MLNDFLSPFALSVRRKTNVSKGTGKFKKDLSFDTFLLRKNTQDERSSYLKQKGSGIICALMVTGGLLTLMSLVIRYTTYGVDISHQRVLCEQQYFALRGLLNYGVMLAEQTATADEIIDINSWLGEYTGKIIILNKQNAINVQARLYITPKEFIDMKKTMERELVEE